MLLPEHIESTVSNLMNNILTRNTTIYVSTTITAKIECSGSTGCACITESCSEGDFTARVFRDTKRWKVKSAIVGF